MWLNQLRIYRLQWSHSMICTVWQFRDVNSQKTCSPTRRENIGARPVGYNDGRKGFNVQVKIQTVNNVNVNKVAPINRFPMWNLDILHDVCSSRDKLVMLYVQQWNIIKDLSLPCLFCVCLSIPWSVPFDQVWPSLVNKDLSVRISSWM